MPTINISLPAQLKADAEALIANGEYVSFSDVVRDGLRRLLQNRKARYNLDKLTRDAEEDMKLGRATTISSREELDQYFATLLKDT